MPFPVFTIAWLLTDQHQPGLSHAPVCARYFRFSEHGLGSVVIDVAPLTMLHGLPQGRE
jgi:hypothetical protein